LPVNTREKMQQSPAGSPRKIAFVFTAMPVGGAEDFALGAGSQLDADFEAHYICLREYGRLGEEAKHSGVPVHLVRVFASRWITPWAIRRFAAWLQKEKIALVHSQTHHAHIFATKAAKLLGLPSVVHQQKTLAELPPRRARIFCDCLARASRIVALSRQTARDLAEQFAIAPEKIAVVANGIDRRVFRAAEDRMALRRELGLPTAGLLVGSIGRLHRHKSHATTIEAVAMARKQGLDLSAVLVGEGAERGELESLARERGVTDAIVFAGPRRPVAPWIQSLDLFVLPSIWEGQPLAMLQAVACGIPLLASDIEGNTAVLGRDHPWLFAPGDAAGLARLLAAASRDAGFLLQLCQSQQRVDIPWSDQSARQLSDLYRTLIP
jgi:glycosyltransferase involved in cell wall biosynthesis